MNMSDDTKFNLFMVGGFLGCVLMLFGSILISQSITNDCRTKAIEKVHTAVEIQAICR